MPKAYTGQEREQIKRRLKKEALNCLAAYGVRKTTVDELVRRANIPKGTFYLFYSSKELLLFDAITELHDQIHKKLLAKLANLEQRNTVEEFTNLVFALIKELDKTQLAALFTGGNLELILRRLPPETVAAHFEKDEFSFQQLASFFPGAEGKPLASFEAAFRAIFLTLLHKPEIGDEQFDESIKLLIRGLTIQLFA